MKIVTWNTQWCKGVDGIVSPNRIIKSAQSFANFDVLCLQEISVNYAGLTGRSKSDQVAAIQSLLPGYQVVFGAAIDEQPLNTSLRQQFGNLIASRLPILHVQTISLPSPIDKSSLRPCMARICLVCTVQAPWGPVRVMTTHLEYHSQSQRSAQIETLARWHDMVTLQSQQPAKLLPLSVDTPYQSKPHTQDAILCGDFNFTPSSEEYQIITSIQGSNPMYDAWCLSNHHEPHPATFRLYEPEHEQGLTSCDFFFVSDSLQKRVQRVRVDHPTQASDHQPVCLELSTTT